MRRTFNRSAEHHTSANAASKLSAVFPSTSNTFNAFSVSSTATRQRCLKTLVEFWNNSLCSYSTKSYHDRKECAYIKLLWQHKQSISKPLWILFIEIGYLTHLPYLEIFEKGSYICLRKCAFTTNGARQGPLEHKRVTASSNKLAVSLMLHLLSFLKRSSLSCLSFLQVCG